MSTNVIPFVRSAGSPQRQARSWLGSVFVVIVRAIANWAERRRQREALGELAEDERLLNDIGLTREQALHQAGKPFWR